MIDSYNYQLISLTSNYELFFFITYFCNGTMHLQS